MMHRVCLSVHIQKLPCLRHQQQHIIQLHHQRRQVASTFVIGYVVTCFEVCDLSVIHSVLTTTINSYGKKEVPTVFHRIETLNQSPKNDTTDYVVNIWSRGG